MPNKDDSLYVLGALNFDSRIKSLRENIGLTQAALARKVGVSTTTIQNYEAGKIPKGAHLVQLSRVLKCSIDYLLVGEESPYIQEEWILENPSGMDQEELAEYHESIKGTWLEAIVFRGRNEYYGIVDSDGYPFIKEGEGAAVDMGLLGDTIRIVEEWLEQNKRRLSPEKKAEVVLYLYEEYLEKEEKPETATVERLLKLVA